MDTSLFPQPFWLMAIVIAIHYSNHLVRKSFLLPMHENLLWICISFHPQSRIILLVVVAAVVADT